MSDQSFGAQDTGSDKPREASAGESDQKIEDEKMIRKIDDQKIEDENARRRRVGEQRRSSDALAGRSETERPVL